MNATLMIVNSETYGGSGGAVPVFLRAADAFRIAVHEMGHSHFHFADEYAYYADCADPARGVHRNGAGAAERHVDAASFEMGKPRRGGDRDPDAAHPDPIADPFCAVCVDTILSVLEPFRPRGGRRRPSHS